MLRTFDDWKCDAGDEDYLNSKEDDEDVHTPVEDLEEVKDELQTAVLALRNARHIRTLTPRRKAILDRIQLSLAETLRELETELENHT